MGVGQGGDQDQEVPVGMASRSRLEGPLGPWPGGAGTVTLLPPQALDPVRAGAGGEAGERQGAEAHVFA